MIAQSYRRSGLFSLIAGLVFLIQSLPGFSKALPDPDNYRYAMDFVNSLHAATRKGWKNWMRKVASKEQIAKGFQVIDVWWCPNHKKVNTTQSVFQQIGRYCGRKGGKLDKAFDQQVYGTLCRSQANPTETVFYVRVWNSWQCRDGKQTAHVLLIEPTQARDHPAYIAQLKRRGFNPNKFAATRNNTGGNENTGTASMPMRGKRPLEIGMQICKREAGKRYIGYVERLYKHRVKITVANVYNNTGQLVNDPKDPKIIWDLSRKWAACEK